jgi:hypothetical protein
MKLNIHSLALLASMAGSAAADFTCVGDCQDLVVSGSENCYTLTQDVKNQVGAVWAGTAADITTSFTASAKLYFGTNDSGADGISFVIQNVLGNAAVGKDGGRLGFLDIGDFFAVDVDTYFNHNLQEEMELDHILVSSKSVAYGQSQSVGNVEDGAWHDFAVSWDYTSGALTVSLGGDVVMTRTVPSISAALGGGDTTAYFGFTAATGGFTNLQQICDIAIPGDTGAVENNVATTPPAQIAPPGVIPECGDFAVFGTTALTFGAGNEVNNGNVGFATVHTPTGVVLDDGYSIFGPDSAGAGVSECKTALASVVAAFDAAGDDTNSGEYTAIGIGIVTDTVFVPGKYRASTTLDTAASINIIFDAQNDPDAVFVIQAGTTLTIGANPSFELRNGAKAQNILWEAVTTATLGAGTAAANTHFIGTIIAGTTITIGADMAVYGRVFAKTTVTTGANDKVNPDQVVAFTTTPARYLRH